jgi:autotransporter-associated beta strand protein
LGGSGTVSFTGGLLRFSSNSVADLSGRIVNSTGAIRIDTGANTVTFASGLDSNNTGGLTKTGSGTLVLSGTNTYTGDTTISNGAIALTSSGALRFVIGGSGTNNALKGNGATSVNGQFVFDLSGASTNTNATWTIVAASLNPTYETGFRVADFIRDGLGNWNKETNGVRYIFSQSNGVLSVQSIAGVTPYNAWVNSWPGFTQTAGTDDPDGDGYNNNMEFAFGTIPTAGSSALLRTATSGGQFVISWLQRIDSSSNYKVEEATDLVAGSWVTSSARVQSGSGATPPDGYEWKQISVTPTGKKFYRVQATIAP